MFDALTVTLASHLVHWSRKKTNREGDEGHGEVRYKSNDKRRLVETISVKRFFPVPRQIRRHLTIPNVDRYDYLSTHTNTYEINYCYNSLYMHIYNLTYRAGALNILKLARIPKKTFIRNKLQRIKIKQEYEINVTH